jgi:lysophospholipase L1-like esterase
MAFATFAAALAALWAGFLLHTSGGAELVLGKYSPAYAGFLAALSAVVLALLYWGWRRRRRLAATFRGVALAALLSVLLAALVLPSVYIYLHATSLRNDVFTPLPAHAHSFFQIEEAPDPPLPLEGEFRVLALGGSTTYGSRLEREQAYPAVLERLLAQRHPGRRVTVINAGVPWHTSMHSLLRYVGRYAHWKPHVVIVMHAFNDIFQASEGRLTTGTFRPDYGHFFGALGMRVNPKDRFASAIGATLSQNWLARTWYSDLRRRPPLPARPPVDLLRALPSFEGNLVELVRRVRDDGAAVVLMTQPYLYRDDMPEAEVRALFYGYYYQDYAQVPTVAEQRAAMDAFNDAARTVARTHGAPLIDLERALPKSSTLLYDDVHYTADGARQVAALIADGIDWGTLLERSAAATADRDGRPGRR